ncbi:MAG TPA: phosphoribosylformylglycinamidine cyclo-ligase [Acidimicrobiales bacterium]|nr:phosphoribosylformylglycinamidine cyclo-ligase [Acidimicrobiales bacterium]
MGETYAGAGVDIAAGEEAVARIRARVRSTFRPEVLGDLGGFGGLFAFDPSRYRQPVLVSSTDGVGTKAAVAQQTGRFDTIGLDLVAMCVDDVVTSGAEPLFFLDYVAVGRLDPGQVEQIVGGVVEGCRQSGCALIGGEMAEHPGVMEPGHFDLAGFAVGVVEREGLVTGDGVRPGDAVLGLPSPGLRCNGYSLARRVLLDVAGRALDDAAWEGARHTLADELLRPSVIYAPAVAALVGAVEVRALAHVTGGGLPANLARVLPESCDVVVHRGTWEVPRIFEEIRRLGQVADDEMARTFNLGIGMVAVVGPDDVFAAHDALRAAGAASVEIGEVVAGDGQVRFEPNS